MCGCVGVGDVYADIHMHSVCQHVRTEVYGLSVRAHGDLRLICVLVMLCSCILSLLILSLPPPIPSLSLPPSPPPHSLLPTSIFSLPPLSLLSSQCMLLHNTLAGDVKWATQPSPHPIHKPTTVAELPNHTVILYTKPLHFSHRHHNYRQLLNKLPLNHSQLPVQAKDMKDPST